MSVASLIADLVRAGTDPELVGRVAEALAKRDAVVIKDEQAERRRAADRERKRNNIPQKKHPPPFPLFPPPTPPPIIPQTLPPKKTRVNALRSLSNSKISFGQPIRTRSARRMR